MAKQTTEFPKPQLPAPVEPALQLAARIDSITITDDAGVAEATEALALVQRAWDEAESARTALVKPLNDHVRFINETFKPKTGALLSAVAALKKRIAAFHTEREAKEQEAARAAAEFMGQSQEVQEIVASAPVPTRAQTASGGVHTVKRWTYEVEDITKLAAYVASGTTIRVKDGVIQVSSLVEPNKGALRRAVNAGARNIPGVRIYQETDIAVTR